MSSESHLLGDSFELDVLLTLGWLFFTRDLILLLKFRLLILESLPVYLQDVLPLFLILELSAFSAFRIQVNLDKFLIESVQLALWVISFPDLRSILQAEFFEYLNKDLESFFVLDGGAGQVCKG